MGLQLAQVALSPRAARQLSEIHTLKEQLSEAHMLKEELASVQQHASQLEAELSRSAPHIFHVGEWHVN